MTVANVTQQKLVVEKLTLGVDTLAVDVGGMTDFELLEAVTAAYPKGVNVMGSNFGPAWVHPKVLVGLAVSDDFGIEATGLAHVAAEILRLASDPKKAIELGGASMDQLLVRFAMMAQDRATSKKPNQVHAHRWGASSKVVASDRVETGTLEICLRGGRNSLARQICRAFKMKWEDFVEGVRAGEIFVNVLRHPFIYGYVARLVENDELSEKLAMANRREFRTRTSGDYDGDTGNYFPVLNGDLALELAQDLEEAVPEGDPLLAVLGYEGHSQEANLWGENQLAEGKSLEASLSRTFVKSVDEWLDAHVKMSGYANTYTPYAYRISEVCSILAAVGLPGAREAGLIGAVVEETFYLGLSGGGQKLDHALEVWFKRKMNRSNVVELLAGLNSQLSPDAVTSTVRNALVIGSKLNRRKVDMTDPMFAIAHAAWRIGKGRVSVNKSRQDDVVAQLGVLADIAGDETLAPELRDNFVVQVVLKAARKLNQVVRNADPDRLVLPSEDGEDEEEIQGWLDDVEGELE